MITSRVCSNQKRIVQYVKQLTDISKGDHTYMNIRMVIHVNNHTLMSISNWVFVSSVCGNKPPIAQYIGRQYIKRCVVINLANIYILFINYI